MIRFLLTLAVMRLRSDIPHTVGGPPIPRPPETGAEKHTNFATAFYWEMYGATEFTQRSTQRSTQGARRISHTKGNKMSDRMNFQVTTRRTKQTKNFAPQGNELAERRASRARRAEAMERIERMLEVEEHGTWRVK